MDNFAATSPNRRGCPRQRGTIVPAMRKRMASDTQGNQVLLGIISALATKFFVVNLEVRPGPARLTSPTVAAQHLLPESFIQLEIEPQAWLFGQNLIHEAFSATSCRKA